jgi:hypothetical protein
VDSNHRPPGLRPDALPLSYPPIYWRKEVSLIYATYPDPTVGIEPTLQRYECRVFAIATTRENGGRSNSAARCFSIQMK